MAERERRRVLRKQQNSHMCMVCGLDNELGLKARFYEIEGNEVMAVFRPGERFQGYPNRLHGGICSALLDEVIGRAIMIGGSADSWGVTVELSTTYRKPVPLGCELHAFGRITHNSGRFFQGTGEIELADGTVAVTATGRYLRVPVEKIGDFDEGEQKWSVVRADDDPAYVERFVRSPGDRVGR